MKPVKIAGVAVAVLVLIVGVAFFLVHMSTKEHDTDRLAARDSLQNQIPVMQSFIAPDRLLKLATPYDSIRLFVGRWVCFNDGFTFMKDGSGSQDAYDIGNNFRWDYSGCKFTIRAYCEVYETPPPDDPKWKYFGTAHLVIDPLDSLKDILVILGHTESMDDIIRDTFYREDYYKILTDNIEYWKLPENDLLIDSLSSDKSVDYFSGIWSSRYIRGGDSPCDAAYFIRLGSDGTYHKFSPSEIFSDPQTEEYSKYRVTKKNDITGTWRFDSSLFAITLEYNHGGYDTIKIRSLFSNHFIVYDPYQHIPNAEDSANGEIGNILNYNIDSDDLTHAFVRYQRRGK